MEDALLTETSVPFKFEPDNVKDCALEVELIQTLLKLLIVPAVRVGLEAACNVFAPPALVEPDFVPDEKVISLVVNALTFMVFPPVGEAAMSVVIKIYPVEPELIA